MPTAIHIANINRNTMTTAMTSGTSGLRVDLARQIEVVLGQATGIVRRERNAYATPADVEIRVMVRLLGEKSDAHDEGNRRGERRAFIRLDDFVAFAGPTGRPLERGPDLGVGERRHALHST